MVNIFDIMTSFIASALRGVVGVGGVLALGWRWVGVGGAGTVERGLPKHDQHVQRSEGRDGSVVVWVVSGERCHW